MSWQLQALLLFGAVALATGVAALLLWFLGWDHQ
jgi:hypothetical protein